MENLFKKEWDAIGIKEGTYPRRLRNIVHVPYNDFKENVLFQEDPEFVKETVSNLYSGDMYVLENAFSESFCEQLKKRVFEWGHKSPSGFHKMLEGVPDFHRIVDAEISKNYSFETIRHVYYFFPWNGDPLNLFNLFYEKWGTMKVLGGFGFHEYEKNTPKDGLIDRIVMAQYPSGAGALETHSDPFFFQKTIMTFKLSERGKDYQTGGFYCIDQKGREVDMETESKVGDMYIAFPTLLHGVWAIDKGTPLDWNSPNGRWFFGFYTAMSDVVKERHTGYGVKDIAKPEEAAQANIDKKISKKYL